MLAAADTGQYGTPPSPLLQLALDCSNYGVLPHPGGLMEQPAGLMDDLRRLSNIYNSFYDMVHTPLDQKTWSEKNPGKFKIVAGIEALRAEKDGRR